MYYVNETRITLTPMESSRWRWGYFLILPLAPLVVFNVIWRCWYIDRYIWSRLRCGFCCLSSTCIHSVCVSSQERSSVHHHNRRNSPLRLLPISYIQVTATDSYSSDQKLITAYGQEPSRTTLVSITFASCVSKCNISVKWHCVNRCILVLMAQQCYNCVSVQVFGHLNVLPKVYAQWLLILFVMLRTLYNGQISALICVKSVFLFHITSDKRFIMTTWCLCSSGVLNSLKVPSMRAFHSP